MILNLNEYLSERGRNQSLNLLRKTIYDRKHVYRCDQRRFLELTWHSPITSKCKFYNCTVKCDCLLAHCCERAVHYEFVF